MLALILRGGKIVGPLMFKGRHAPCSNFSLSQHSNIPRDTAGSLAESPPRVLCEVTFHGITLILGFFFIMEKHDWKQNQQQQRTLQRNPFNSEPFFQSVFVWLPGWVSIRLSNFPSSHQPCFTPCENLEEVVGRRKSLNSAVSSRRWRPSKKFHFDNI